MQTTSLLHKNASEADYLLTAILIDCCCILLCHLPDFGFKFSFLFIFFQGFIVQLSISLLLQNSFCFGISFNNFQWWISPLVMILLTPHLQQETSYILTSGNQREGHLFAIWLGFLQPVCPRYPRLVFSGLIAQISSLLRIWGQQSKKRRI